jgi:hypothetical protein
LSAPENLRAVQNPLVALLDLSKRARQAGSMEALRFLLVNDTRSLLSYRQSALWSSVHGVQALSGVLQAEANAPYVQWLKQVMAHCSAHQAQQGPVVVNELPAELRSAWSDWLPQHAYWVPLGTADARAGFLLARDLPWSDPEGALLGEWVAHWQQAWLLATVPAGSRWRFRALPGSGAAGGAVKSWWARRSLWWVGGVLLLSVLPVRLTVLAPAELVPAKPLVVRAPLEGVIETVFVQPNESVRAGQLLFQFDEAILRSRLDVARQALMTAEVEYRQVAQQAFQEAKANALLATLAGKIEEKRHEASYIDAQLSRARVVAPQDGIALIDDPSQWVGRPVSLGEAVMRVAELQDVEVEAWVGVADAIPLAPGAPITLHLNASPLLPVKAAMRYVAHGPVERPDGSFAYRMRATVEGSTAHRVGLKGTARIDGERVPLVYWALRRPWAAVRAWLGV